MKIIRIGNVIMVPPVCDLRAMLIFRADGTWSGIISSVFATSTVWNQDTWVPEAFHSVQTLLH
jgi:hypothetical protein